MPAYDGENYSPAAPIARVGFRHPDRWANSRSIPSYGTWAGNVLNIRAALAGRPGSDVGGATAGTRRRLTTRPDRSLDSRTDSAASQLLFQPLVW